MSNPGQLESRRLAALLAVPEAELGFLESRSLSALARLRRALASSGMQRHRRRFERLASASALLPAALAARLAQERLGAELIAALAPFLPAARAAAMATRLSPAFLAEVAIHLVPETASELLATLPAPLLSATLRELLTREEYAVMGNVVDYLPLEALGTLAAEIEDPRALLAVTAYVGDKSRLGGVIAGFSDQRLIDLARHADQDARMDSLRALQLAIEPDQARRLQALLGLPAA